MAIRGAGPSRRSHTKSRKGCKTCKRRHIRCDESFPQCRNCTKHQVRCDYMDTPGMPSDSETRDTASPELSMTPTPPILQDSIHFSQSTNASPYAEVNYHQHAQMQQLPATDAQFGHYVSSLATSLTAKGVSDLTIWTSLISRFIRLGSENPFLMDALHAWTATLIAWSSNSAETRKLSIHYGSLALRGLHDAIGNFTQANSDSALAASLLLAAQATDWRSWSSLDAGILSVIATMEPWRYESTMPEFLSVCYAQSRDSRPARQASISHQDRYHALQDIQVTLQQLRPAIAARQLELGLLDQLIDYIQRLQASEPAQTPEEQFNHLYILRKWILLVPVKVLEQSPCDVISLALVGHFYATALVLEPLFPDVASRLCAVWVVRPLNEILKRAILFKSQDMYFQTAEMQPSMQFMEEAMAHYCNTNPWARGLAQAPAIDSILASPMYSGSENLSPAFAPAQVFMTPRNSIASSRSSSFLEVPTPRAQQDINGFTYNTSQWGTMPSPSFPPQDFSSQPDLEFDFYEGDLSQDIIHTGFVTPCEIWT